MTDYYSGKNVLVTGATGFLGPWLVKELLAREANVVAVIRDFVPYSNFFRLGLDKKTVMTKGCIEDYNFIERVFNEYEIDTCFHLAAQAIVNTANRSPLSTFESNIKGTWNVLEAARNSKLLRRIVVASSDKAYGSHKDLPYKETAILRGLHPYDASKSCADILSQMYFETYGLPVGITRCGNFYGGGDLNFNRLIPGTIKSISQNSAPVIRSDGTFKRDYIYILDAVDAYLTLGHALDRKDVQGEAFNFSTNNPMSVIEVVNLIIKMMGSKLESRILNEAKAEIKDQYLDSTKAKEVLGWKAKYAIEPSLKETIKWYKEFFKAGK